MINIAEKKSILEITINDVKINKGDFKKIFNPGYTSKKRGWGLGLSLSKRIVEDYHNGKIFVKSSKKNIKTVIQIEFDKA